MAKFPKMNSGEFPHLDTVDVNQWQNDFDYTRYDATQMKLTICAVPWDMGEAHIGNRTISGIGNVVYFGSKENRDAWFDAIPDNECYRWETKYKELHRDQYIDVAIPFDVAAKYNYLVVEYSLFANDSSPVMYEREDGHRKWFWFIREVEFVAPNTTRLHILDDAFQTWIYDVNITGMILERGHAPMFETNATKYLADPIDNAAGLLTEDVNYGEAAIARSSSEFVFNAGNMYAVVITTANTVDTWGTKAAGTWQTPGLVSTQIQGIPSYDAFALEAGDLATFLENVNSSVPQFLQTVKAIAFVSGDLLSLSRPYTFAGTTCYYLNASYVQNQLLKLNKNSFGYAKQYAEIAKLYTYPYAYILVTDEQGNETEIRIEHTNGTINIESNVSLVFPWLTINAHLTGIGKTARKNITFANVTSRNMPLQGNWYETLQSWNIPTFGVYQDAGTNNDYATHFDRQQAEIAYTNEYTSRIADADTAIANTAIQTAANSSKTAESNAGVQTDSANTQNYNDLNNAASNGIIGFSSISTIQAQEMQAAISAASGAASGAAGAIAAAASGNIAGALSSGINAIVGAASTMAQTEVATGLTAAQGGYTQAGNNMHTNAANIQSQAQADNQTAVQSAITNVENSAQTGITANSAATMKANAGRAQDTAQNAVTNQIAQAELNTPVEFGAWQYGDLATSRPMGLFANIVTQTDAAINAAGDEMLRYGYTYGRQWEFDGNWNIGKYFTYWKLKDFWVSDLNVPDMYMDKLRFFLFGGVTIWRNPADIGKVTVYDNFS